MNTGLLLLNLGTPKAPTTADVRNYLREFLSDPCVIDLNPIARKLLLEGVILPFRPAKSAEAYRAVWTDRGSPLLFHSRDLEAKVRDRLSGTWPVALAMRYGEPSIRAGLAALSDAGVDRVVAFPLYPQYAMSSTLTSEQRVHEVAKELWASPSVVFVPPFYAEPGFIEAFAAVGKPIVDEQQPQHVLFSFHGLPERHLTKTVGSYCKFDATCCASVGPHNRQCYRAQAYVTARGIAAALSLPDDAWSVSFQSRLGRTPWIQPYTDVVLPELAQRGVERVTVFCPAFVADCLETLEEIGIRAVNDFRAAGGSSLRLVPSLNSSDAWADTVVALAQRAASAG